MAITLAVLVLWIGPLVSPLLRRYAALNRGLDGFMAVTIAGLVLLHILPEAYLHSGWWVFAVAVLGFVLPRLAERGLHLSHAGIHRAFLLLTVLALVVHGAADGAALQVGGEQAHDHGVHEEASHLAVALAIILHKLPVGLLLWFWVGGRFGRNVAIGSLAAMSAVTLAGFFGFELWGHAFEHANALLLAFVGGGLLHVLFGHGSGGLLHVDEPGSPAGGATQTAEAGCCASDAEAPAEPAVSSGSPSTCCAGSAEPEPPAPALEPEASSCCATATAPEEVPPAGQPGVAARHPLAPSAAGIGGGLGLASLLAIGAALDLGHSQVIHTFTTLFLVSAPALSAGFLLAGLAHAYLPHASLAWLGRGSRLRQSFKGMAFGLPLPICSCGVVPLYRTLVNRGAPPAAALAFLVATPELGIDALLLSIPLLGWQLAVIRLGMAVAVAVAAAWLVSHALKSPAPGADVVDDGPPVTSRAEQGRLRLAIREGLVDSVDSLGPWLLLGLVLAALVAPLFDMAWLRDLPMVAEVLIFALIGLPTYVCATAATPLAAIMLMQGVSPGAALAFLLTGPASNVTTFGVLSQLHSGRVAAFFAAVVISVTILLALALNAWLAPALASGVPILDEHAHGPLQLATGVIIAGLLLFSLLRKGPRELVAVVTSGE